MSSSLSTFCAQKGICSKKDAKRFIELGYIKVNNQLIREDIQVKSTFSPDKVRLSKRAQAVVSNKLSVILHQPEGYISTFTRQTNLWSKTLLIPENRYEEDIKNGLNPSKLRDLMPVKPLECRASGLAIFSEDRSLISRLQEKEEGYHVVFKDIITEAKLFTLTSDIHLDGVEIPRLNVTQLGDYVARIAVKYSSSKVSISSYSLSHSAKKGVPLGGSGNQIPQENKDSKHPSRKPSTRAVDPAQEIPVDLTVAAG